MEVIQLSRSTFSYKPKIVSSTNQRADSIGRKFQLQSLYLTNLTITLNPTWMKGEHKNLKNIVSECLLLVLDFSWIFKKTYASFLRQFACYPWPIFLSCNFEADFVKYPEDHVGPVTFKSCFHVIIWGLSLANPCSFEAVVFVSWRA